MATESSRGEPPVEVEWQFDAQDLARAERWATRPRPGVRVGPRRRRVLHDTYLDSPDGRLYRAGYALRVRRTDTALPDAALAANGRGPSELTLKALAGRDGAIARRLELTETLADPAADPRDIPGPLGARVVAALGAAPLAPLFDIVTERTSYAIDVDGVAGELAFDRTRVRSAGKECARLQRLEVETTPRGESAFRPYVEMLQSVCGLPPASTSKFEAGLRAARFQPPASPDRDAAELDASHTAQQVFVCVWRRYAAEALRREPGTRVGDDVEELHRMRVATRRLRSLLRQFRRHLPAQAGALREELTWLGGVLGPVRDLDVQLADLDRWRAELGNDADALSPLCALLRTRRDAARGAMLAALDSDRYTALAAALRHTAHDGFPNADSRGPAITAVAPRMLRRPYRAVRRAGDDLGPDAPAEDLHRLRIRAKRLRYALESLAPIYGRPLRRAAVRVAALQDVLGEHHDAVAAVGRFEAIAGDPALPRATIFVLGELAERARVREAALRKALPHAYARATGKRWRRAHRALKRRA